MLQGTEVDYGDQTPEIRAFGAGQGSRAQPWFRNHRAPASRAQDWPPGTAQMPAGTIRASGWAVLPRTQGTTDTPGFLYNPREVEGAPEITIGMFLTHPGR